MDDVSELLVANSIAALTPALQIAAYSWLRSLFHLQCLRAACAAPALPCSCVLLLLLGVTNFV